MPFATEATKLNIRQLRALHLLLRERNVSRAAALLRQGQPAVSATLKHLRSVFNDPLLVRSGNGMVLTERAEEISFSVRRIIEDLDHLIAPDESFNPATSRRHVHIATANCFDVFLIPALARVLRQEAPHATFEFTPPNPDANLDEELEQGRLDAIIGNWPAVSEGLKRMVLTRCDIVCLMSPDHPMSEKDELTLNEYMSLSHVSPTPNREHAFSPIDGPLAQKHLLRNISICVPEYSLIPHVLIDSDLVFTTGRPYAEYLAERSALKVVNAPKELGEMSLHLLWHERSQHSNFQRWIRGVVRRVVKQGTQLSDGFLAPLG